MVSRSVLALLVALGALSMATSVMADEGALALDHPSEPTLSADRPTYGDSTSTVPPMRLALEAGSSLTIQEDRLDLELPEALLRFGLTSWLEVRLGLPGLNLPVDADDVPRGSAGGVGFKVAYAPHERFAASFVSTFGVPVAELADGQSVFSWSASLNLGLSLNETFTLGATVASGLSQDLDSEGAELAWQVGGALGVTGTFDATGLYIEGVAGVDQSEALHLAIGLGLTQMLTPQFQLDLSFSYDLPSYGDTTRVSLGLATLF